MENNKKYAVLILALALILLCCINGSVGYAEEDNIEEFVFEPRTLNALDYFDDDAWYGSSYDRAAFTFLLSLDLADENEDFDALCLLNGSYVGKKDIEGITTYIVFFETDNDVEYIALEYVAYVPLMGDAFYFRQELDRSMIPDLTISNVIEFMADELCESYYRNSYGDIEDVVMDLSDIIN